VTTDKGYLLDNQQSEAGRRFEALSELFDPVTFRHLAAVGVSAGWSCWEVGAGGPSVPTWLAEQVGPSGRVVAGDLDTAWMPASGAAVQQIRDRLVAAGLAAEEEIEQHLADVAAGNLDLATAPLISAWGRKPL
jgi:hypothetical protein